jgi:hypothetical protein
MAKIETYRENAIPVQQRVDSAQEGYNKISRRLSNSKVDLASEQ